MKTITLYYADNYSEPFKTEEEALAKEQEIKEWWGK
jgi:predicted GIY-YIG superfamily endonuclease